jgi:hypothetical protein
LNLSYPAYPKDNNDHDYFKPVKESTKPTMNIPTQKEAKEKSSKILMNNTRKFIEESINNAINCGNEVVSVDIDKLDLQKEIVKELQEKGYKVIGIGHKTYIRWG